MTTILILEGNSPDLLAKGKSDTVPFVKALMGLDASVLLRIVNPYAREITPDLYEGVDGVVFSGSGVHWNTGAEEAAPQRAAMERVFDRGLPVWGSCNGMQLAAVVLGGGVGASPKGDERGIGQGLTLTEVGKVHPMMAGKAEVFESPTSHRDEVQGMPEGAELIVGNAHSPVQAFVYERNGVDFWGTQYHPECSALDVAGWVRPRGAEFAALADDLMRAETDIEAAARLGTTPKAMTLEVRARELINWLAHVKAR